MRKTIHNKIVNTLLSTLQLPPCHCNSGSMGHSAI